MADTTDPAIELFDVPIIVGSGVAGLATALHLDGSIVVTKGDVDYGSSALAQGGIAAALGPDDRAAEHAADTIAVGGGLVDEMVANLTASAAPRQIGWLQSQGTRFDRTSRDALALGREAGHSAKRIVHADGDATGREIVRALLAQARSRSDVTILDHLQIVDLAREGNRVVGVVARSSEGEVRVLVAPAVVLATGGIGGVYAKTTNPRGVRGDGLVLASRAGALLGDLEFVQFHPTALDGDTDPLPLLTEALRGAGAVLLDAAGARFMERVHRDAELAPRDIVARAVWDASMSGGAYLDATVLGADLPDRFPTVYAAGLAAGFDARVDPLPVTPAAHYHMGGVVTDPEGRSSLPGLYACGEVATTGLHGANRLASNSLLEGLVFAERVADSLTRDRAVTLPTSVHVPFDTPGIAPADEAAESAIREAMWAHAGVVRSEDGLSRLLGLLDRMKGSGRATLGTRNLAIVAGLVARAALARRASRGSHYRSDYPNPGTPTRSRVHQVAVPTMPVGTVLGRRRHVA